MFTAVQVTWLTMMVCIRSDLVAARNNTHYRNSFDRVFGINGGLHCPQQHPEARSSLGIYHYIFFFSGFEVRPFLLSSGAPYTMNCFSSLCTFVQNESGFLFRATTM